ncbi:MucR family transcriptional regulator [Pararhizobium mangrovi]|uniref:MucR family transcriptional regulator n=1 Tax=Pararhizobium mangrovi TaxID=2590452 RepID=A0A506TX99_9HYPH|nr:MucR family transcriptional regulator [Pararhizobium mangrovi]TPW26683.1 MucR family transcriptional regulator [Pararhizobium mangrovi]
MDENGKGISNTVLAELTADIVSAYVGNNIVPQNELPALIGNVHAALAKNNDGEAEDVAEEKPVPAVSIKRSLQRDYLVCLEDGKKFKSLKRHLRTQYGMTPDEYRAKWNLPSDYPMVAPAYAQARSQLARDMGLGQKAESKGKPAERSRANKRSA